MREPFAETEYKRGGHADGTCMRKGCEREVPSWSSNKFYCCGVCGRLANPENPEYAATRVEDLRFARLIPCPRCHGNGQVDPLERGV